jgi:hypothetical protein
LVEPPGECRSNLVLRRSIRAPTCQTRDADAPFLYTAKKAAQSPNAAIEGLYDFVLSSQGRACIGRLDPRSCHRRGMSRKIGGSVAGGAMDDVASNAHNS